MNYIKMYPKSTILYVSILLICLIFSRFASNKKNIDKRFNIWVVLIIVVVSVFLGIRGETVGIDVQHYIIRHIEPIREGLFSTVNQPFGFKALVWLVYQFTNKTYMVFIVFAFLTNGLIIMRLRDFRKKASFPLMFFFYYCYFYLITFNVFRQFIAISIVFFMTRFLEKKKYLKFCIGVAIAISIHSISILGFLLLPIEILISSHDVKHRRERSIFLMLAPFILLIVTTLLLKYFDFKHYLDLYSVYNNGSLGIMTPVKIVLAFIMYFILKKDYYIKNNITINKSDLKKIFAIYFLGLCLALLVGISSFADRFAWYFLIWEPIFMSLKIRNNDFRLIIRGVYIILSIYALYIGLNSSGQGIMPYITIFN